MVTDLYRIRLRRGSDHEVLASHISVIDGCLFIYKELQLLDGTSFPTTTVDYAPTDWDHVSWGNKIRYNEKYYQLKRTNNA